MAPLAELRGDCSAIVPIVDEEVIEEAVVPAVRDHRSISERADHFPRGAWIVQFHSPCHSCGVSGMLVKSASLIFSPVGYQLGS